MNFGAKKYPRMQHEDEMMENRFYSYGIRNKVGAD